MLPWAFKVYTFLLFNFGSYYQFVKEIQTDPGNEAIKK